MLLTLRPARVVTSVAVAIGLASASASTATAAAATLPALPADSYAFVKDAYCYYWFVFPRYTQPAIQFESGSVEGYATASRIEASVTKNGKVAATATLTQPGMQKNVDVGRFGGWTANLEVTLTDGRTITGSKTIDPHGNPDCIF